MDFYFSRFEHRRPPEPLTTPRWVMFTWQVLAVAALILGANYIYWRWTASLNTDALWYAIPLVLAETLAWIGTVLFTIWAIITVALCAMPILGMPINWMPFA